MKEKMYLKAIEQLNDEIILLKRSSAYKAGTALCKYLNLLKRAKFQSLVKSLCYHRATSLIEKKYAYSTRVPITHLKNIDYFSSKIVVYTCITGNYDDIKEPLLAFDNVDYIAFVDTPLKKNVENSLWTYKPIPNGSALYSEILKNRYIKFHPKEFFSQYDYSIYVDGNIRIVSDIRSFVQCCNDNTGLAMHVHGKRDCCYDEAQVCLLYHRGNAKKIKKQMQEYRCEGFPKHFGLNEANVIVSDLNNHLSATLLDKWWQELVRSESLRDQLAWPYVLWKNELTIDDVGCLGVDVYTNAKFQINKHN